MDYVLMNKNTALCRLSIDMENYVIDDVFEVYNKDAFPVGVDFTGGKPQKKSLAKWWAGRAIPGSRIGAASFERRYAVKLASLPFKNYGLSLTDQYWLNPLGADAKEWKDINFFHNEFSSALGQAFFDESYVSCDRDFFMSPDSTSDGMLPKKWVRDKSNGKLYLYKAGSGPFEQEPFNELIASKIFALLGTVPFVKYQVVHDGGRYFSTCENFINDNTELVTAANMRRTQSPLLIKADNEYAYLLRCCAEYGMDNVKEQLDVMLAVDYIICNTDRHYGNFGFIRNVETLQFEGIAPVYDSGTSLWNKDKFADIGQKFEARAFTYNQDDTAKLITHFELIDLARLSSVDEIIADILSKNENLPVNRITAIVKAVKEQIKKLQKLKDLSIKKPVKL